MNVHPVSSLRTAALEDAVAVENVAHRYGDRAALRGVSFSVRRGEIFGLLGPNGGGKTTLFRILSTLLHPTSGRFSIAGVPGERGHEIRRQIGVVFQNPSVDGKLTVWENLLCHGQLYGLRRPLVEERARALLERFSLAERRGDLLEQLSGGMKRRVELAKALLHQPAVLLLDEPSTGLDPGIRREFFSLLQELRDQVGLTVVLTTHFMEEAERCDRVAILHQGSLVALGEPSELKAGVGGDVLVLQGAQPARLVERLRSELGLVASVVDGAVRVERPGAHELVPRIVAALGDDVTTVTYGRPTLEDVFVHHTGQRFWSAEQGA